MKTLKLFNAVLAKPSKKEVFVSEDGYIIEPKACWAKDAIINFYNSQKLDGQELNKTFHKSWDTVRNTPRETLWLMQITHYLSTYGSDFKSEVFIPDEILDVPNVKLTFKVIKAYTKKEMTDKCLDMLCSGMALKEDTINDILTVLVDELGYTFTGDEGIRNKEAVIKIADMYGILPKDTMQFFRYIVYRATGESLLIKNREMINKIKESNFNPGPQLRQYGLDKMATIFNRFKPLFLAFKDKCPATINKISKLSKVYHKPMVENPLNMVTSRALSEEDLHWLDNATPFALFKALSACHARLNHQTDFCYRIRNGKSYTVEKEAVLVHGIYKYNYKFLMEYMKQRFNLEGTKVFFPDDIEYALPTSEKMFVGDIPTGTKFYGDRLAVGMYWENDWGARDLDLSALNISGNKVGWNSHYSLKELTYSGDITNAPNGAVEYLHADEGLSDAYIVKMNVFSGSEESGYKIVIGRGDSIDRNYMMNPNNIFAQIASKSVQRQMVLGLLLPAKELSGQSFVLLNFGAGHANVSGANPLALRALYQQWNNPVSLNLLLLELGAESVEAPEDADIDLSLDNLERDTFIKIFDRQPETVGV